MFKFQVDGIRSPPSLFQRTGRRLSESPHRVRTSNVKAVTRLAENTGKEDCGTPWGLRAATASLSTLICAQEIY